jgi:plasmid stability protein
MANLTLSIDDELLKRARIRAVEQDTSVNAIVRDYLRQLVGSGASISGPQAGMAEFLALTESTRAGSGPKGRTWTRDELYER